MDSPPEDIKPVESKEIPEVMLYVIEFRVYESLPENVN